LAAKAPDIANNVNKKLIQKDLTDSNRNDFIANGHNAKMTIIEKQKIKQEDFWEEEEDDDDDDNDYKQPIIKQSQPIENNQTVNNNKSNSQQVKKPKSSSTTKTENNLIVAAITPSIASLEHSQPSSRSSQLQSIVVPKKSGIFYSK